MGKVGGLLIGGAAIAASFVLAPYASPFITQALFGLGASMALGSIQQLLFPARQSNEQMWENVKGTNAQVPVVYGETRVGAVLAGSDNTTGSEPKHYRVLGICVGGESGHGIESIEQMWFERTRFVVTGTALAFGNGPLTTNIISTHTDVLAYGAHRGADGQTVDTMLNAALPAQWPSTSRGEGIAYVALRFDPDGFDRIPNVTFLVRGARIYDPRDPTGGPSSDGWTWDLADASGTPPDYHPGQNQALWLLDYLTSKRYGVGAFYPERDGGDTSLSMIDEASFITAANQCDDDVQDGDGGSQARFTGGGIWLRAGDHKANLAAIASAARLRLVFESGKWRCKIRDQQTAETFEFNETNIIGGWNFVRAGSRNAPNRVVCRFGDAALQWATNEAAWPEPGDANQYLTDDNGVEQTVEMDLPGTDNWIRAQQIGMVGLKESREDVRVQFLATADALQVRVDDVVPLRHETPGWSGKEFWIDEMELLPDDTVQVTLSEYSADAYTLDPQSQPSDPPGTTLPDPFVVDAPTSLVLTSDNTTLIDPAGDGGVLQRIKAAWTASSHPMLDHEEVRFKKAADSEWIYAGKREASEQGMSGEQELIFGAVEIGTLYDVKVEAVTSLGGRSAPLADQITPTGKTTGPAAPTGLTAVHYPPADLWLFYWTPPADEDLGGYQIRHGTSYASSTLIESIGAGRPATVPLARFKIRCGELPDGYVTIRVRAVNRSGVPASSDATVTILNSPRATDVELVTDDQWKKRAGGPDLAIAGSLYDRTGLAQLVDQDGNIDNLAYGDTALLNQRQPIEGAAQRNWDEEIVKLTHGESYTDPGGRLIISAKYLGGAMETRLGPVWGTDPGSLPGSTAAPDDFGIEASFEFDGASVTPSLLLKERVATSYVTRSTSFADNLLTFEGDATGVAAPLAVYLPAEGDAYWTTVSGEIASDKGGAFSITVTLQARKNGGIYYPKATEIIPGTIPTGGGVVNVSKLLSAYIPGWDGAGGDDAIVVVEDVSAPGNWAISLSAGALKHQQSASGTPLYAEMCPNGEKASIELKLEPVA